MSFLNRKINDMSPQKNKNKAEKIIQKLNIRNPSELAIRDIAMEKDLFVKEQPMDGSEGRLLRKKNHGIITINKKILEEGRKRFAIAHEIGHFELHSESQLIICTEQDMMQWKSNNIQEIEANEFAANLLMPEFLFRPFLKKYKKPEMESIIYLANEFRTTLTATALRYVQLSKEPCALAVSKNGIIKWYQKSLDFNFHIKVGERVSPDSYAFEFFRGNDLPDTSESVSASAWISGNIAEDSEIMESSFSLPRYNIVLSLLWIYENIHYTHQKREDECDYDLTNPIRPSGKRWLWD